MKTRLMSGVALAASLVVPAVIAGDLPFGVPKSDKDCALALNFLDKKKVWDALKERYDLKKKDKKDYAKVWNSVDESCEEDLYQKKSNGCLTICKADIDELRATQSALGLTATRCKADKLASKVIEGDGDKDYRGYAAYLAKYPKRRFVPVVIAPNNKLYVLDHHHLSSAARLASQGFPHKYRNKVIAVVVLNLNETYLDKHGEKKVTLADFKHGMTNSINYKTACQDTAKGIAPQTGKLALFWPCSKTGTPITFQALFDLNPKSEDDSLTIAQLVDGQDDRDDPLRSLSRWVRNSYGYVKSCDNVEDKTARKECEEKLGKKGAPYFLEFQWANFIRAQYSAVELRRFREAKAGKGQGMLMAGEKNFSKALQYAENPEAAGRDGETGLFGYNKDGDTITDTLPYEAREKGAPSTINTLLDDECRWANNL